MSAARHLLGLDSLVRADLERLLARAHALKEADAAGRLERPLSGKLVANVFFEDSTRTRSSFEIAARKLGADVLNWTTQGSSQSKGETLLDTLRNLDAMGPKAIVMRHASTGAPHLASRHTRAAIVNAGDGTNEHPSQGLLDAFTLQERLGSLEGKKILIVGDILHSRVARSNLFGLPKLGAQVIICGPLTLLPRGLEVLGAQVTQRLDDVLGDADAVMVLRLQLERQAQALFPSPGEYARLFGLNADRAARMKPGAPVLHPGPMNRGLEISPEVADGPRSAILGQVTNGVAVRMAILEAYA